MARAVSVSIINQFKLHDSLCLCLASVHLPYPFHLVSAFSFSVTPFRFASSGTISSMRFRAASSILAQYCLTYTQLLPGLLYENFYIYRGKELQFRETYGILFGHSKGQFKNVLFQAKINHACQYGKGLFNVSQVCLPVHRGQRLHAGAAGR